MRRLVAKEKMGIFYSALLSKQIVITFICAFICSVGIYFFNKIDAFNYLERILVSICTCFVCMYYGYSGASKKMSSCLSDGAPILRVFFAIILFPFIPIPSEFFPYVLFLQAVLAIVIGVASLVSEHDPLLG